VVNLLADGSFDLCVSPTLGAAKDEVLRWKDLPPFFTIFDGGYDSISRDKVNELLEDLIAFHELVSVRCHFELNNKSHSVRGKWGDQENLKTLSEILIDWDFNQKLEPQQLVLIEIELFETVYFVIGIYEESDQEGVVLSLTSHFYQQRNRVGRRIPIDPIIIDGFKILEVSDFGMKVSAMANLVDGKDEISLVINDYALPFGITYRKTISSEEHHLGVYILDHSPEARKAWQGFLLEHQYPLLRYRKPTDYNNIWSLYSKTGYLIDEVELIENLFREKVNDEWTFVDSVGPACGATVLNMGSDGPIATIGVTKAFGGFWAAQSAAVIDSPDNLKFTRSIYSWRTRFILQQIDSRYHLAFFLKNKPFLDRFFRKFYLSRDEKTRESIVWEEWIFYSVIKTPSPQNKISNSSIDHNRTINPALLESSKYIALLKSDLHEDVTVNNGPNYFVLNARPFIHIAQYFNVAFTNQHTDVRELQRIFANQPAFTILSSTALDKSALEIISGKETSVIGGHEEVTWACPRQELPNFLQNSLKSLEIMIRKYSSRTAA
jgi:hypothetical protein